MSDDVSIAQNGVDFHPDQSSTFAERLLGEDSQMDLTCAALAASRRKWIDSLLIPWCMRATRVELIQAEADWQNLAGKVDPDATLWHWAWSRFDGLTQDGLPGLNETQPVQVTLTGGKTLRGYPDNRRSEHGRLVLLDESGNYCDPVSIDDVLRVEVAT